MALPVSVLVPTYNRAAYLPETLDAILSQTHHPAEVIVLDDGSTDHTASAVARFGHHIRYIPVQNGGVCRARNLAASFATSPLLAFCDSDDLWHPDKLAQQIPLHEQDSSLEFSFTNFVFFSDQPGQERNAKAKFDDAPPGFFSPSHLGATSFRLEESLYDRLLTFQPIWPSTIVISAAFFRGLGGFVEAFRKNPSEDFEFSLRCVQQAPIGIVPSPVVSVRRHADNFSVENYRNTRGQIDILEYVLRHHTLSESTRSLVQQQIYLRRVEASYDAFRKGEFAEVNRLLAPVPAAYLDRKTRLKASISHLPAPFARTAHKLFTRE